MLNLFTHLEINTRYLWPLTITKGCNKLLLHAILMRQMQSVGKALSNSPQCDYYFVKKKKSFLHPLGFKPDYRLDWRV